jgi:sec-independent protein translocase protein TatB
MGKARKMAAEFQGQFQEAMREAEMADLKKSFDEVREAASGLASGNVMTSLQKDVTNSLRIDDVDKPMDPQAAPAASEPVPSGDAIVTTSEVQAASNDAPVTSSDAPAASADPVTPSAAAEPLVITPEIHAEPAAPAISEPARDAKAS